MEDAGEGDGSVLAWLELGGPAHSTDTIQVEQGTRPEDALLALLRHLLGDAER